MNRGIPDSVFNKYVVLTQVGTPDRPQDLISFVCQYGGAAAEIGPATSLKNRLIFIRSVITDILEESNKAICGPLLETAMEKSGLNSLSQIERALKLWNEIYDLDKAGWKFNATHKEANRCMAIQNWELTQEDPTKTVSVDRMVEDPSNSGSDSQPLQVK